MRKLEVKKLSDFEIIEKRWFWGDSISTEAQNQVYIKSSKSSGRKRGDGAVEYCM